MKKVLLIGLLSLSLNVMAGVPLLDLIAIGGKQLVDFGITKGLKQVENESLQLAFGSLTKKSGIYSGSDINKALRSISPSIEYEGDKVRIARMLQTLNKTTEISNAEMKALVDDSTVIGNRYGNKGFTCAGDCGEKGDARLLVEGSPLIQKFTTEKFMSNDPSEVRKSIGEMAAKLKVGDLSTATTEEALSQEDEKIVHILLTMATKGNKEEKEFAKSIIDLSKHGNGPTNIFDTKFVNRLYRVLSDKNFDKKMTQYTDFFKRVDAHVTEPMSAREKLVKYMEEIVAKMDDTNPEKTKLKDAYDEFIRANCFK